MNKSQASQSLRDSARVLKAAAEPGRLTIIKLLETGPQCVCRIQAALGLAQPTVSRHLKLLEEAGLLTSRRRGTWVHYALAEPEPGSLEAAILNALAERLEDDPGLAAARLAMEGCPGPAPESGPGPGYDASIEARPARRTT